jgi:hypothetical protein
MCQVVACQSVRVSSLLASCYSTPSWRSTIFVGSLRTASFDIWARFGEFASQERFMLYPITQIEL